MKTMRLVRNLALGAFISIAAAASVSAQHRCEGGPGRDMPNEEQMDERLDRLKLLLELTPEQEAQVKALAAKHAKEAEAERAKMREEHQKKMEAHKAEMKSILTAEQFAKFEALQEEHKNGKGHGNKRKAVKK